MLLLFNNESSECEPKLSKKNDSSVKSKNAVTCAVYCNSLIYTGTRMVRENIKIPSSLAVVS